MSADRCRWVKDAELEAGGFWLPGCWARVMHDDNCDCQPNVTAAAKDEPSLEERVAALEAILFEKPTKRKAPRP